MESRLLRFEKNYFISVMAGDDFCSVFAELSTIQAEPPHIRSVCQKCRRPSVSCWCCYLPQQPLSVKTQVYILQHPFEETRSLQTAPMLMHGLADGQCHVIKGKRFSLNRFPELDSVLQQQNTILLFPGPTAVDMSLFREEQRLIGYNGPYNLVVLDGTWHQARGIYCQNTFLHSLKQVQLNNGGLSKYVIRTQPTDSGLSTVETVALAIGLLEDQPEIYQILTRPLDALCEHQLKHGAVRHHSKQHLIENGLYIKAKSHLIGLKKKSERLLAKQNNLSLTDQNLNSRDTGLSSISCVNEVLKSNEKKEGINDLL